MGHTLYANVDKALKILARFIIEDKTAVIKLLNDGGYARLPLDASTIEVNEAVADNIFDERFVEKMSEIIFDMGYSNSTGASQAAEAGQNLNPIVWIAKIGEIGSDIYATTKQEEIASDLLEANYQLEAQQIERESEIALAKAKQDFAFELLKAQQEDAQDNTMQNLVLLLGVIGFLAIAYNAVRKRDNQQVS